MLRPLVTMFLLGYKFKSLFSTWGSVVCCLALNPLAFNGVEYNFMDLFAAMLLSPLKIWPNNSHLAFLMVLEVQFYFVMS